MQKRFVCKSWYNLVRDPYFIHSHLSEQRDDEKRYLVTAHQFSKTDEYYSFRCAETFVAKLKVERPIYGSREGLSLVGCAKGLLLILDLEISDSDLYLWNPSLGKIKCLPSARASCKISFHKKAFGFAFFPEICDYKVIRMFGYLVGIYSLRTDSWRIIEKPFEQLFPCYDDRYINAFYYGLDIAAFVNPFFYWVVKTYEDNHENDFILSFSIERETFKTISLPVPQLEKEGGVLALFQESHYLFTFRTGYGWNLWMMREDNSSEMCWLKICTFEYQDRRPVGFMQNGDVIMEDEKCEVYLHDPRNPSSPRKSEWEMRWEQKYSEVYNETRRLIKLYR
ncbi:F-box/LRR-repeat/kelch-repeat protein At2g27520-like isoform X4 [Apium graveolens]|uniref:F-box/LRR-repeat/kelch-repeat protein At2g27520-like isoform X4 n=1 Tax=Apium graveolens TaxID=4045 RepID=UPI003D7AB3C9